ncbi:MAG: thioredoxin family protein [Deltaproteobacteria bacterium]|nr:thioredoxin family protein [Deltaproteobacteria bacterium]
MKDVRVLGSGCANCRATIQLVEDVAKRMGVPITLTKVDQIQDIARYGILATPGVVIDGAVVHAGGIPSRGQVERWFAPTPS